MPTLDYNPKFALVGVMGGLDGRQRRTYEAAARLLEAEGVIVLEGHTTASSEVVSNPFWKRCCNGQNWRVRRSRNTALYVRLLKPEAS